MPGIMGSGISKRVSVGVAAVLFLGLGLVVVISLQFGTGEPASEPAPFVSPGTEQYRHPAAIRRILNRTRRSLPRGEAWEQMIATVGSDLETAVTAVRREEDVRDRMILLLLLSEGGYFKTNRDLQNEVLPHLTAGLRDDRTARLAIRALAGVRHEDAVAALARQYQRRPDPAILEGLADLDLPSANRILVSVLESSGPGEVRSRVAEMLRQNGARGAVRDLVSIGASERSEPGLRVLAIRILAGVHPSERPEDFLRGGGVNFLLDRLRVGLETADGPSLSVIQALSEIGSEAASRVLARLVEEAETPERLALLVEGLSSAQGPVVRSAMRRVFERAERTEQAVAALRILLRLEAKEPAAEADFWGEKALPFLEGEVLKTEEPRPARSILSLCAEIGGKKAVALLVDTVQNHRDVRVRREAALALAFLEGTPDLRSRVQSLLQEETHPLVKQALAQALGKLR